MSPCSVENSNMSYKNTVSDREKRHQNDQMTATGSGSSITTSAFDRLRYNLSPVTSYYKPLMKSFTRRDGSPTKVSTFCFLSILNQSNRNDSDSKAVIIYSVE